MRPAGQFLGGAVEVVDVVLEGRVEQRDDDLRAAADGEPPQVGPAEAHPEVGEEVPRTLPVAGPPGGAEEADPQSHQRGHDVPLGRHGGRRDGGHLGGALAGDAPGDHAEDATGDLAGQEPDEGVEEPPPGSRLGQRRHPGPIEERRPGAPGHRAPGPGVPFRLARRGEGHPAREVKSLLSRYWKPRWCVSAPAAHVIGVEVGHRHDDTGPPGTDCLQVGGGHRLRNETNSLVW